ncbi:Protein kinase domain containing protein [Hordeum vulgare]|nr:Protein kinase domain containing protein [Hordeum vulgare]
MEQKVEIPESKLKDYIQDTDKTKWRLKNNHNIKYFSEDEIKRITSNYSTKLGNGAFGEVYKGVLDDDQWVAVKKYICLDSQQEFAKEVIIHSQINHKNVIRLVGCCIDENAQMMVLEHASNGNLSDRLHCDDNPISLATRLNIAIECAEALNCMHSMYNPVIHLDIKPSNILLGDDFHAKISDFGISRLLLRDNIESTINVKGCIGYMDPAFTQEGCLTVKSDVYSFGVLEAIGAIANKCLNEEYDARPEMNDVAGRLRDLRAVLESGQGKSQTGWRFFNGGQNELKTEKPGVAWSSIFSRNTTIFKKGYPAPAGIPRYSYGDLKMMTKNFTDVLGRGAYCTVYRGHLPDGRAVAVKQLDGVGGSEVEFWSEVTIMARMNHRNIVSIWGWCADKGQRMLILEFISNGSLDKHVLPASTQEDDGPDQRQQLDLNTRHQIALGVAHAMAYMHEECSDGVLHCDIKPHNILLDDNFCPKLTDFGLSTWLNKTMSRVRGTRGYMAPEWVIHREVITAKADVYSFGMVLLEVVSGRNYNFREESVGSEDWYFPKWVYEKCCIHHKIEDILDPILQAEACQGTGIAELMVNTAIWCLQDRAEKRPSMGKVVKMLDGTIEMTKQPEKPVIFCACDD